MNCTQCEERMSDYLESAITAADREGIDSHVRSCAACNELLAEMREVLVWAKTFPIFEPPAWLATRILGSGESSPSGLRWTPRSECLWASSHWL